MTRKHSDNMDLWVVGGIVFFSLVVIVCVVVAATV
jgi:hypothetical protein